MSNVPSMRLDSASIKWLMGDTIASFNLVPIGFLGGREYG